MAWLDDESAKLDPEATQPEIMPISLKDRCGDILGEEKGIKLRPLRAARLTVGQRVAHIQSLEHEDRTAYQTSLKQCLLTAWMAENGQNRDSWSMLSLRRTDVRG